MIIGTKSILFGYHQFIIHPLFVALAWWRLYGFPYDPRLWCTFLIHDLGYIGKPNMDGVEGKEHPEFAARIIGRIFGKYWRDFCYYHSRTLAKRDNQLISRLCVADKFAIILYPNWLFLLLTKLSGELKEYIKCEGYNDINSHKTDKEWLLALKQFCREFVESNNDILAAQEALRDPGD